MASLLWQRAKALFGHEEKDAPPDATALLLEQAVTHHKEGRLAEAGTRYEHVLAAQPDHAAALNLLGVLAGQTGNAARSAQLLEHAIRIDPSQPGFHSNLALALNQLSRGREAIASCERAIALDPECVEAHSNKGTALWGLGRREEALESYAKAVAVDPGHAETHWNEGYLRMQLGQFETGWIKQEWRWKLERTRPDWRAFPQPRWLGKEDLRGKTILLYAEQGLGDTIQFCRYAKRVAALGATVVLEVQRPLRTLLEGLEGVSTLVSRGEPLPAFDYHCPLLSLPLAFNTTLESIPSDQSYLRPPSADSARWQSRLGPKTRPRVGVVWQAATADKSVPLADLLRLVTPDKHFFSLQPDVAPDDQALLDARNDVLQPSLGVRNFADAPLVALMDLVITADTSMAHLAGALGKPVWVMLLFNPEWRWMLDREDSPWYPTARLFRQPAPGDWASVVERVRSELGKL